MTEDVRVNRTLTIPGGEIRFTFTTSGGPGGQHANRSSTRAVAEWNVATSRAVGPRQHQRIRSHLKHRIDSSGVLRIASDRHRSQLRNRNDALERMALLVAEALRPQKARVETAPTRASRERRLREKKRRAEVKRARKAPVDE